MFKTKKLLIVLLFIVVLATILRVYRIDSRPLYGDEFFSLSWSSYSVKEFMLKGALRGNEKPLYFLMLLFWRKYVSDTQITMRLLSVFAGVLSVFMLFILAKRLTDTKIGLLSAFILAISPIHIYYSQEIRMYAMQNLFTLFSFYFFLNFFLIKPNNQTGNKIGYLLSMVIAMHLHILAILALLVQNIYLFLRRKDAGITVRDWIGLQFFILFLTPQVIIPIFYIFGYKYGNWAEYIPAGAANKYVRFPLMDIPKTFSDFSAGYLVRQLKGSWQTVIPVFLFFVSIFALGIRKVFYSSRKSGNLLLSWCFLPVVAFFLLYFIIENAFAYRSRYVLISSFAYYIILAAGIASLKNRLIRALILAGVVVVSLVALTDYYKFHNLFTYYFNSQGNFRV